MDVIVLNVSDGTKVQTPDTKSYINVENAAVVMDLLILNHKEQAVDPKLIASSHLTKRRSSSTMRLEAWLCPRVLFLALTVFLRSLGLLISRKDNRPGLVSMIRLSAQPLPNLTWGGADSVDMNSVARQSNAHLEASPPPRNRPVDLMPGRRVATATTMKDRTWGLKCAFGGLPKPSKWPSSPCAWIELPTPTT
jgi:hypothetical protein